MKQGLEALLLSKTIFLWHHGIETRGSDEGIDMKVIIKLLHHHYHHITRIHPYYSLLCIIQVGFGKQYTLVLFLVPGRKHFPHFSLQTTLLNKLCTEYSISSRLGPRLVFFGCWAVANTELYIATTLTT